MATKPKRRSKPPKKAAKSHVTETPAEATVDPTPEPVIDAADTLSADQRRRGISPYLYSPKGSDAVPTRSALRSSGGSTSGDAGAGSGPDSGDGLDLHDSLRHSAPGPMRHVRFDRKKDTVFVIDSPSRAELSKLFAKPAVRKRASSSSSSSSKGSDDPKALRAQIKTLQSQVRARVYCCVLCLCVFFFYDVCACACVRACVCVCVCVLDMR